MFEKGELRVLVEEKPKTSLAKGLDHPHIAMADITVGDRYVRSRSTRPLAGGARFRNGDTLLARITPCLENGKVAQVADLAGEGGFGSTEFFVIRAKHDLADPGFVYLLCKTDDVLDVAIKSMSGASGRQRADFEAILSANVPLPPLPIQKRIAAILSAYDDLIEVNTRRIAILEEIARRIYDEWFVSGADPAWERKPLGEVCERITDGAHKSPPSVEVGKPMASVKDMHAWGFELSGMRQISEEDFAELERQNCRPRPNDILIAKDGANLNKHTFLFDQDEEVVLLSSVAILRPGEAALPEFLVAQLKSERISRDIKQMRSGAAIPRIILKDFKRLPVLVPPLQLQKDWERTCGPMAQLCRSLVRQNANLRAQRDLLLPRLVFGKLDVSALDAAEQDLAHA